MVSIKWCMNQKNGLELVAPSENLAKSYLNMAKESLNIIDNVSKSRIWTATTAYYIFYYSLYSLMSRIGVKCEIHSCSLEFMKRFLMEFYNTTDMQMIRKAFDARIDLQYYSDRPVDIKVINEIKKYCGDFYTKTKEIIIKIREADINEIRGLLEK